MRCCHLLDFSNLQTGRQMVNSSGESGLQALQVGVLPSHLRSSVQIRPPQPKKSPFSNFPVDCNYPNLFLLLRNRKNSTAPPSSQQNRRLVIKSDGSVWVRRQGISVSAGQLS